MSELLIILVLVVGFIALPLTLFPSVASSLLASTTSLLLVVWNFSKLFFLAIAALVLLLAGEHVYRSYLRKQGVIDPAFAAAEARGQEREGREERLKNEVEAFARTSGVHGVVKGAFRALTGGGHDKGRATTGGSGGGKAKAKASAGKESAVGTSLDDIELKPVTSSSGTTAPKREGLRQRAAGSPAPAYR